MIRKGRTVPRQAEQREDENASVHQAQENRRTQVHSVTSGRMDSQDRLPGRTDHSRQACGRHARARARASGQSLLEVSGIQSHADRCGGGGVCVWAVPRITLQGATSASCPAAGLLAHTQVWLSEAGRPHGSCAALSPEPGARQGPLFPTIPGGGRPAQAGGGVGRCTVGSGVPQGPTR